MKDDCVVELFCPTGVNGGGKYASGYLVKDNYILTCRHALVLQGDAVSREHFIWVKPWANILAGNNAWIEESWKVCWDSTENDLALLKLQDGCSNPISSNSGLAHFQDFNSMEIRIVGFPKFKESVSSGILTRGCCVVEKKISGAEGLKEHPSYFKVRVNGDDAIRSVPKPWKGMSGAAVFNNQNRMLIGVVIEASQINNECDYYLNVKRISVLETDLEFLRLLGPLILDPPQSSEQDLSSNAEKLHKFLLNLNYHHQEGCITDSYIHYLSPQDPQPMETNPEPRIGILLAEVGDERIQRWMIQRLIKNNPYLKGAAKKHLKVSDYLKVASPLDRVLSEGSNSPKAVCKELRNRHFLFTFRDVQQLNLEELSKILDDFYQALANEVAADTTIEKKCVLLLVGGVGWTDKVIDNEVWSQRVLNSDWKWEQLTDQCISNWFDVGIDDHKMNAGDFCGQLTQRSLDDLRSNISRDSPLAAIESISYRVLGEDGLAQLETHWKLGA